MKLRLLECAAEVSYLVSSVPDLPLLSRNPNFTLQEREWARRTHTNRRKMKAH